MPSNVEIKARVSDVPEIHQIAKKLSKEEGKIINQDDTFFNCINGRLKLRKIEGDKEELIFYQRPDQSGPKLSNFKKVDGKVGEFSDKMHELLSDAFGVKGRVIKKRTLYIVGQTRVHIDEVEGLGDFMELEVCLNESQTAEEGEKIALQLMEELKIAKDNLIEKAYVDLLADLKQT